MHSTLQRYDTDCPQAEPFYRTRISEEACYPCYRVTRTPEAVTWETPGNMETGNMVTIKSLHRSEVRAGLCMLWMDMCRYQMMEFFLVHSTISGI